MEKNKIISEFKTIFLKRTPCYGRCPVYEVKINSDGNVFYKGEMFVEKVGPHFWKIDTESINALNAAINKYEYFSIKAKEHSMPASCCPSCITSICLEDGTNRNINNEYGGDKYPKKLRKFERQIDKIIGIDIYIGKTLRLKTVCHEQE